MSLSISSVARAAVDQMFTGLEGTLKKGAAHAKASDVDPSVYLDWRVAPDMFPLKRQVVIATELPARSLSRLAGAPIPSFDGEDQGFDDLIARIAKAREIIVGLSDAAIDANPDADIVAPMGPQEMTFKRADYFQTFILPNLYFHVTASYLILRSTGVDVGKRDFLAAS